MSNVVRTDIDSVNAVLTVTIPKEEYLSKVQNDIKKYSQKAPMKGFRPGKTPPTLIKRMYGQQFLMDAVNDKVQQHLNEYSQRARTEDEFADLKKHQPNLQPAGIEQTLQPALCFLRVFQFGRDLGQGGPIKPRTTIVAINTLGLVLALTLRTN